MPIHEILKLKASADEEVNMAIMLAMHCAPILKGSKEANILTVSKKEFANIKFLLDNTNICYRFLKSRGDKTILYLYREKELDKYMNRIEIKQFLAGYGYGEGNIKDKLERLSERILLYGDGKLEFPHEIGIFLGYPLIDVKGFIENDGKNYMYSGYWKVYHNVKSAMKLFKRFDEEREMAVREVVLGKTIQEVVV